MFQGEICYQMKTFQQVVPEVKHLFALVHTCLPQKKNIFCVHMHKKYDFKRNIMIVLTRKVLFYFRFQIFLSIMLFE